MPPDKEELDDNISRAIKRLKCGKAPGNDGILEEALKAKANLAADTASFDEGHLGKGSYKCQKAGKRALSYKVTQERRTLTVEE